MRDNNHLSLPRAAARALFVLATVLILLAVGYLAVQTYAMLHRTYKTETAISYTMSESMTLKGAAVFQLVEVPGSGNLGYVVDDGERVSEGTVLAEQYTDDSQGVLRERLDRLDSAITLLSKSENSSGSDLTVLTTQTRTALYNLLEQLADDSYSGISAAAEDFLLAQNKLQVSTGQVASFADILSELQSERDAVAARLDGLQTVTASTNGYFVSAENTTPAAAESGQLDELSPSELQSVLDAGSVRASDGLAGYIVTGFSWRFYAVCTADEAESLDGLSTVGISVPGKQSESLSATVEELTVDTETGLAKIVLECRSINADILRLNYEDAKIDLHTYTGIRIDRNALHIVDGQRGVYVKYGDLQRFRKITILYEDENYILVPQDGALGSDNEVRLYDEVIVEGTNLQDGKLL